MLVGGGCMLVGVVVCWWGWWYVGGGGGMVVVVWGEGLYIFSVLKLSLKELQKPTLICVRKFVNC